MLQLTLGMFAPQNLPFCSRCLAGPGHRVISQGRERRRRPFLRRSVSLLHARGCGEQEGCEEEEEARGSSTACPGAHPCLSPHLHDVSEIAIALTHPWLALATTTAKASPEAGEPRPMWGADPTRGARTVNTENHQSPGHGKGFLGWQQLSFAFPP